MPPVLKVTTNQRAKKVLVLGESLQDICIKAAAKLNIDEERGPFRVSKV